MYDSKAEAIERPSQKSDSKSANFWFYPVQWCFIISPHFNNTNSASEYIVLALILYSKYGWAGLNSTP